MKKYFALLALLFAGLACTTAPTVRQIQNAFPIEKPFESVWQATIETFSDINLPILNVAKDSGLITTDWISFTGQKNETGYCDCGEAGVQEVEKDRLGKLNVYVKKISDTACEVRINSVFEQHYVIYNNAVLNKRPCVSTGKLEADMFKLISEKAK
jgi:hypothetical protein